MLRIYLQARVGFVATDRQPVLTRFEIWTNFRAREDESRDMMYGDRAQLGPTFVEDGAGWLALFCGLSPEAGVAHETSAAQLGLVASPRTDYADVVADSRRLGSALTRISAQLVRHKGGSVDLVAQGAVAPPGHGGVLG